MNVLKVLTRIAKKMIYKLITLFMISINKVFRIDSKKIVFMSFHGKSYSDNPKAISQKLYEEDPSWKIIWLFNNPNEKISVTPHYVKRIKKESIRALIELATAKVWVDNFNKPNFLYKSDKQIYIQTWHGDRGFKRILYDRPDNRYKPGDLMETDKVDVMTVGSVYGEKKLRSAFKYKGKFIKEGSPRNDILLKNNTEDKLKIKKSLSIPNQTKVLLFAPTFRNNSFSQKQDFSEIDLDQIIKVLKDKTQENWIALVRAHKNSRGLVVNNQNNPNIIDVTTYEDMADLLLIADFFITDYSSSAGDYILRKKPLILYQPDITEYKKNERPFYFNIEDSPFIVTYTQSELVEVIKNLDLNNMRENCKQIMDYYGVYETGNASKMVVKYIINEK